MGQRRQTRRQRRDRASARPVPPAAEPGPAHPRRDISLTGLIGGLTGAVPLGARAIEILVDPKDVSRFLSIPLFVAAAVYLPAIWASVAQIENRKRVLRNILSLTLVLLVVATLFTRDPGLALLLLIPSSLLAVASGIIFQGPRARQ